MNDQRVDILTPVGDFLGDLFAQLDEANITYCVLRGYEGLPGVVKNDVDLLVCEEHMIGFKKILRELSCSKDWTLIKKVRRFGFFSWYLVKFQATKLSTLHLDLWTKITWKSFPYIDVNRILDARRRYISFWIPPPGSEAAVTLLKDYLQYGKVKDKGGGETKQRMQYLVINDPENFLTVLWPYFGEPVARYLLERAVRGDWSMLEAVDGRVRRRLIGRALVNRPVSQVLAWFGFLWGHFADKVLHPSGLFLCLIGPDGSGKTTVSDILQRNDGAVFGRVRYYHGRWGLLPELKSIHNMALRLLGMAPKESCPVVLKRDADPISGLRCLLYALYYAFDDWLGYIILWWARGRGDLLLFDRYFYDYRIQQSYSQAPRWVLQLLERFIPQPDIMIILSNKPEAIRRRKPELDIPQIQDQLKMCEGIVRNNPNSAFLIWTDDDPDVVMQKVNRVIYRFMAAKVNKHL